MPDKLKKALGKTRDPVKGGSGTGTISATSKLQKFRGKQQSVLSTRVKKKLVSYNKPTKEKLGYSKGGIIQHD